MLRLVAYVACLACLAAVAHAAGGGGAAEGRQMALSLLKKAAGANNVDAVREVLSAGVVDVDQPSGEDGQTPLMRACLSGSADAVKVLLEHGADWKVGEMQGYTCMHGAAFQGRPKVAKVLLEHGVPGEDRHEDGYDPIHRACWRDSTPHAELVRVLVSEGSVSPDLPTAHGETPLMVAARTGAQETVQTLLELGADPTAVDADGQTAADKAMSDGIKTMLSAAPAPAAGKEEL